VTEILQLLVANFAIVMAAMLLLWLLSIALKDVSFIDIFWAGGLVLVAVATFVQADGARSRKLLLLALTAAWGLRLAGYLFWRWRRDGPDKRYVAMIAKAKGNPHLMTLRQVFLLQGVLLWTVSLPVQLGQAATEPAALGPLAFVGAGLAVVGILFESIGDWQLAAFKADAANRGKVMDRGLWRYTRHPNYFGDLCVWWGLWLIAAETRIGLAGIVGPALLTWLLVQYSGAALLERRLKRSKPEYEDYARRTSAMIPLPPRRA
jgi:steroid 5-alpha reductase family enzyme